MDTGHHPIRLIFLDLDGTLLSSKFEISSRNTRALERAIARGIHVVLASGRPTKSVLRFTERLQSRSYIISSNGGSTLEAPSLELLRAVSLEEPILSKAVAAACGREVSVCWYSPQDWFVESLTPMIDLEIDRSGVKPTVVSNFASLLGTPIKLMFIGDGDDLAACRASIEQT